MKMGLDTIGVDATIQLFVLIVSGGIAVLTFVGKMMLSKLSKIEKTMNENAMKTSSEMSIVKHDVSSMKHDIDKILDDQSRMAKLHERVAIIEYAIEIKEGRNER